MPIHGAELSREFKRGGEGELKLASMNSVLLTSYHTNLLLLPCHSDAQGAFGCLYRKHEGFVLYVINVPHSEHACSNNTTDNSDNYYDGNKSENKNRNKNNK